MWMKQELDRAMDDVRLSDARKAAILRAAREEERPRAVRFPKRVAVLAAVLIACLTVTAAAVSLDWFTLFHEWMGGFDEAYQPQEGAVVDQGIEMQMVGVLYDSTQLEMLFTIKDVEGGRLNEDIEIEEDYDAFMRGSVGSAAIYRKVLEYREDEDTLLYRIRYEPDRPCHIKDVNLNIWELYHETRFTSDEIDLTNPPIGEILPGTPDIRLLKVEMQEDGLHMQFETPGDEEDCDFIVKVLDKEITDRSSGSFSWIETEEENISEFVYEPDEEDGVTMDDLAKITRVGLSGYYKDLSIKGDWSLPLNVEVPEERTYTPENVVIDENEIGEISVSRTTVRMETERHTSISMGVLSEDMLSVRLRDGTEITASGSGSSGYSDETEIYQFETYTWTFETLIDPEEVECIILRGVEIQLE